ncbi:TetR/AcrR family transcriptional regulator [Rhodococcus sp. NPDC058521]|uniref:TetR/AcrR family transcriptional regulator n=1 Tax=Rhodococcus sp. NPDC058521 TaxID=3346536 RepID=UPI0036482A1C
MTNCLSLRDRKKAATRAALAAAAAQLAHRVGIEHVTADVIASEAGVSTRTFHNYFANKEEAVLAHFEEFVKGWVEVLRARPAEEPILDSLEYLTTNIVTDPNRTLEETFELIEIVESSPALIAKKMEMHTRITRLLGSVIAERTGTDLDRDLYPSLVHMMVGAVCKSSLDLWLSGKSDASGPDELVQDAFRQIRAGLPQPH